MARSACSTSPRRGAVRRGSFGAVRLGRLGFAARGVAERREGAARLGRHRLALSVWSGEPCLGESGQAGHGIPRSGALRCVAARICTARHGRRGADGRVSLAVAVLGSVRLGRRGQSLCGLPCLGRRGRAGVRQGGSRFGWQFEASRASAWPGWHGIASPGKVWRGAVWLGVAGEAWSGLARRALVGSGVVCRGTARFGVAGVARDGFDWRCCARQGLSLQGRHGGAGHGASGQGKPSRGRHGAVGPGMVGLGIASQGQPWQATRRPNEQTDRLG